MKSRVYFCLFVLLFSCLSIRAQEQAIDSLPQIVSFPNYLTFRTGVGASYNDFGIVNNDLGLKYSATPNADVRTTFSLLYRSLEIAFGFAPSFLNTEKELIESKLLVFNFRAYLGQWMQSFDYYSTVGFELKDTNFETSEDLSLIFADLNVLKIGGTTSYVFNKNYSFRAISYQNEWQRKSSGSFIPRLSFYYTRLKNDSPERNYYYDITAGPSYFYNWVIAERFIVSAGLKAGMGLNITTIQGSETSDNGTASGINYNLGSRISLGYNSLRFFTGINANIDYFVHGSLDNSKIEDRQNMFEFYVGYRFKAPEKFQRSALWVNKKFGWD